MPEILRTKHVTGYRTFIIRCFNRKVTISMKRNIATGTELRCVMNVGLVISASAITSFVRTLIV